MGVGLGDQGGCEGRIEVFVIIQKQIRGGGVGLGGGGSGWMWKRGGSGQGVTTVGGRGLGGCV